MLAARVAAISRCFSTARLGSRLADTARSIDPEAVTPKQRVPLQSLGQARYPVTLRLELAAIAGLIVDPGIDPKLSSDRTGGRHRVRRHRLRRKRRDHYRNRVAPQPCTCHSFHCFGNSRSIFGLDTAELDHRESIPNKRRRITLEVTGGPNSTIKVRLPPCGRRYPHDRRHSEGEMSASL